MQRIHRANNAIKKTEIKDQTVEESTKSKIIKKMKQDLPDKTKWNETAGTGVRDLIPNNKLATNRVVYNDMIQSGYRVLA